MTPTLSEIKARAQADPGKCYNSYDTERFNDRAALIQMVETARSDALEEAAAAIEKNHIISGSIGPLYGAGWAASCKHQAATIRALKSTEK